MSWLAAPERLGGPEASFATQGVAVVDGFLAPGALQRLQGRARAGRWTTAHALWAGRSDSEGFDAAPEGDRLGRFLELDPDERGAEHVLRTALASPSSLDFFERLTGRRPRRLGALNVNAYRVGHELRPHTDSDGGRRLCAVLYFHLEWQPGWGGALRFDHPVHRSMRVAPTCNRLVVFDPSSGWLHCVEPLRRVGWTRWSVSFWFT